MNRLFTGDYFVSFSNNASVIVNQQIWGTHPWLSYSESCWF